MPESTESSDRRSGADDKAYEQIHFAWAEPTLLGRVGPGPAATSLPERDQPVLRSWRDRLLPALTADYRSALPGVDPGDYPETLWAHHYPDGQSALVYRWPGDVRDAHAWAIVGPTRGLTLSRILSLHENPNTRPAQSRPPTPGWATMRSLTTPDPWELTAAPGALRTRDRRAAETRIGDEPLLVGAIARALAHPDRPIHITLDPERADLWQATQLRFLWGMHRILHDVLTPPATIPAAGWSWSFSTYDPVLGVADGPHLVFGPPGDVASTKGPFPDPAPVEYLKVADGLVTVLREEGGDTLVEHLRSRGVPEGTTFARRLARLHDWLDPRPTLSVPAAEPPAPEPRAPEPVAPEAESPGTRHPEPVPAETEVPGAGAPGPEAVEENAAWHEPESEEELQEAPDPFSDTEEGPEEREFPDVEDPLEPEPLPEPRQDLEADPPESPEPPEPEDHRHRPAPEPKPAWTIGASSGSTATETPDSDPTEPQPLDPTPEPDLSEPLDRTPESQVPDHPEGRAPADAPPLPVLDEATGTATGEGDETLDYAAETEPEVGEGYSDSDDNWPTHYVDLPLARLERWHRRRGPEGARTDVADVRAAIRAERAELGRVRGERDHYHSEVQELRREIARLDQSWIDADPATARGRGRRLPRYLLLLLVLLVVFLTGLETGSRTDTGVLDLLRTIPGFAL